MANRGLRRLAVISGDPAWCSAQAACWQHTLPGDWPEITGKKHSPRCTGPSDIKKLLGREYLHGIFDALDGFHAEAFAALAGTLRSGSWLLLLIPPLDRWHHYPDLDSLRWSGLANPVTTPHFVGFLRRAILSDQGVLLCQQGSKIAWPDNLPFPFWRFTNRQQQALCQKLLTAPLGIYVVTASRGRGKSALAGMLARRWPGRCWVTAPSRAAAEVLAQFAGDRFSFIAPDQLIAGFACKPPADVDWLLIDEAAAIPSSLLQQLIAIFPRVLLTTTIQGYEGTGRGFVLKFCADLPKVTLYTLHEPMRWAQRDPLESWTERALLFSEPEPATSEGAVTLRTLEQSEWGQPGSQPGRLYQLLSSAHYRTSPLDLRRMMDAPGQHFSVMSRRGEVQGGVWLVDEGELLPSLAWQIWAGFRRPPGNLVAQSLAAHGGLPLAPTLRARRITRIALVPSLRRQGWGKKLVAAAVSEAGECDYLSVSFGFSAPLLAFWQACDFQLVRIGTHREASSGCYAAMVLRAISPAGRQLLAQARRRFADELGWLLERIALPELGSVCRAERLPDEQDWLELAGFAFASRPFEATLAPLGRLVLHSEVPLPLLSGSILHQRSVAGLCHEHALAGRRALICRWREEAAQGLYALDARLTDKLRRQVYLIRQEWHRPLSEVTMPDASG